MDSRARTGGSRASSHAGARLRGAGIRRPVAAKRRPGWCRYSSRQRFLDNGHHKLLILVLIRMLRVCEFAAVNCYC